MTRGTAHLVLLGALILLSTSGPFLHMAGMDPYAMVLFRMGFAAPIFLGWAAARGELRLERKHWRAVFLGAACLAAHFCLWIEAFELTDFASNLLLLVFQPVIAAFLGIRLGEKPTRDTWLSIVLACGGLAIIAGGDFALGRRALLGDALCILGDLGIALFYVVARDARRETPLPTFMGYVTAIGAILTIPVVLVARSRVTGYPPASWGWLAAIVVLTTVGGHGITNLAARHVRLFALNVVIILEPAIGILIGALLFPVSLRPLQLAGGALLALAVVLGLRDRGARPAAG